MSPIQFFIRPVMALLAVLVLAIPMTAYVPHGTPPVQIAGDDPKVPTGG